MKTVIRYIVEIDHKEKDFEFVHLALLESLNICMDALIKEHVKKGKVGSDYLYLVGMRERLSPGVKDTPKKRLWAYRLNQNF